MGRNFHNSKFRAALKTVAHVAMCCYSDESRGKGLVLGMKETVKYSTATAGDRQTAQILRRKIPLS